MNLALRGMKLVLMPRQGFIKNLDQDNRLTVLQLRELIRQQAELFEHVVLKDQLPPGMDIKAAWKLYNKFNILRYIKEWVNIPVSCSCPAYSPVAFAKTPFS